jgi:plastocyanin
MHPTMSRLAALLLAGQGNEAGRAAAIDVQARDVSGNPVPDAAVYAVPLGAAPESRAARTAAVEQFDREFVPYVSVIQAGTTVSFPNRDPILHHVYSFSPAKPFEIKLYTGRSPTEVVFDRPGVVTLGCNIHDWMIGYIAVVPTAHFARTDAAGAARLRDLPAGRYEVHAWHPQQRAELTPHAIAVEARDARTASFVFDIAPRKAKYKPPLERSRY